MPLGFIHLGWDSLRRARVGLQAVSLQPLWVFAEEPLAAMATLGPMGFPIV